MKFYLFTFLFFFLPAISFGQATNNTNNNTNVNIPATPVEKKEKAVKKSENLMEVEAVPAMEAPVVGASIPVQVKKDTLLELDSKIGSAVSTDSQKSAYLSNYKYLNEQRSQRSLSEEQVENLDDLLRNYASAHPETYESYLFYYLNGQNDLNRSKALLKAQELKPDEELVQKEMLTYYVLMNKQDEKRKALLDLSQNEVYPVSTENYGEDLVKSVPSNSVLITHGKEDSYAAMYAQSVKRIREDVEIISLDWLTSPQFRANLAAKGWVLPESDFINTEYLAQLCALNPTRSIAISLTLPKEYLVPILDKLYVSGLALEYLEVPTDLNLRNEELWNDDLNKKVLDDKNSDLRKNYLPLMMQLKKHYEIVGNAVEAEKMAKLIQEIIAK